MSEPRRSLTARSLNKLVRAAYYHPWLVIGLAVLLFAASMGLATAKLEFLTNRSALVDQKERFRVLAENFEKEFPENDEIVVLVEGGQTEDREAFVDQLGARLKAAPEVFRDVFARSEMPFLKTQAMLYFPKADLENLVSALREAQPMMRALATGDKGVGALLTQSTNDLARMLPVLNEILGQLLACLETRGNYHYNSPFQRSFFEDVAKSPEAEGMEDVASRGVVYTTLDKGRKHLLLVRDRGDIEATITRLKAEIRRLRPAFPGLEVGITGEGVLDFDEMNSSINDSSRATLWSLALVSFLFVFAFNRATRPLMAIFALVMAMGWTMGFITLAVHHLNLLTVTFATMLVGLGMDFGIHIIYRYEEERSRGAVPLRAMELCMDGAGIESFTGALTTCAAFYAITFTDFRGVAELGLIAGTGVLLCFLAMSTVLPAMIFLQEGRNPATTPEPRPSWAEGLSRAEDWILSRSMVVLGLSLVFTVLCLLKWGEFNPKFDYDLLNLQSHSLNSVQTELKLVASGQGVLSAVSIANTLEEARTRREQFLKLPSVEKVESVEEAIPPDQQERAKLVDEVEALMAKVPLPNPEGPTDSGSSQGLMKMGEGFQDLEQAFSQAYPHLLQSPDPEVRKQAEQFHKLLNRLFSTLEHMGPGPISDGVTTFQHDLYGNLHDVLEFLKSQRAQPPITLNSLPDEVRVRGVGKSGKILVRVYPKGNPWERNALDKFVKDIQSVDPDVIGTPVMIYYHTEALKRAYEVSGWYAFGAIAIILLIHFRALSTTLLALLPKVLGVIWMLGIMGYYKVSFNPANFMALPLILGIGLIFGVHVVHRLLHEPGAGIFSHSTGPAIALSALTTMCGFGTLITAHHQGIASLGFLMTVGVGANLVTSLVVLPAVMRITYRAQPPSLED